MAHSLRFPDIQAAIKSSGLSERQLEAATGIPRTTLRRRLSDPNHFTLHEYAALTAALHLPELQVGS